MDGKELAERINEPASSRSITITLPNILWNILDSYEIESKTPIASLLESGLFRSLGRKTLSIALATGKFEEIQNAHKQGE